MLEKTFIPLYLEHMYFLLKRVLRLVTKIITHCSFDEGSLKKYIILMNGKSWGKITEKKIYKP